MSNQFNTDQFNSIKCKSNWVKSSRFNSTSIQVTSTHPQFNTIQFKATNCHSVPFNSFQFQFKSNQVHSTNAVQRTPIEFTSIPFNPIQPIQSRPSNPTHPIQPIQSNPSSLTHPIQFNVIQRNFIQVSPAQVGSRHVKSSQFNTIKTLRHPPQFS